MNPRTITLFSFLFFSSLFSASAQIHLQVRAESENQTVNKKALDEIRGHWLAVEVSNGSAAKLEGLVLKWTLYASNLQRGTNDIVAEKSGESKIILDVGKHEHLITPKVPFKWTPRHSDKTGSGRSAKYKKVDETGHRYYGYHVQVLNGETVVGEAYSQDSLKHLD